MLTAALVLAAALVALAVSPARAVLIDTGDGTGNTTPPITTPGFANVGRTANALTGVYVRNGWVLTANHVGVQPITLAGVTHQPVDGSGHRFSNPDATLADLLAYKLRTRPALPDLLIVDQAPSPNALLTLVGNGRDRGAATTWMGVDGYTWLSSRTLRWGTNRISLVDEFVLDTQAVQTIFDDLRGPSGGQHEADIVPGDSGGAAFVGSGVSAELLGILFARGSFEGQPANTSIYGNVGFIADLHAYRSDLLAVIDRPDCDDGIDEDGDGLIDYPDDPGCSSPGDESELDLTLVCDNGLDDDLDGTIDSGDPGCDDPTDGDERGSTLECDNGLDDDDNGFADFPDDPGCLHPENLYELPEPGFGLTLALGALALAGTRPGRRSPRTSLDSSSRSARSLPRYSSSMSTR